MKYWCGYQTGHNYDWSEFAVGNYRRGSNAFMTKRFYFDLDTCVATSYDWWVFVLRVGNTIYLNDASYSMQTRMHQHMAHNILKIELPKRFGLKIEKLDVREGLNHLDQAVKNREFEIEQLLGAIKKPRSWKSTNDTRRARIQELKQDIKLYKRLIPKFDAQFEKNRAIKNQLTNMRDLNLARKESIKQLREKSPARIVLKDTAFLSIRLIKRGFVFDKETLYVLSVKDFLGMNFIQKFWDYTIREINAIPGISYGDARAKLKERVTVAYVTARVSGEPLPKQVVIK